MPTSLAHLRSKEAPLAAQPLSLRAALFWFALAALVGLLAWLDHPQARHDAAVETEPPLVMFPDPSDASKSCIIEAGKTICLTVIVD